MTNYKYKEIKRTESILNERILDFIKDKNEVNNIIDNLDIDTPPLDNWITSDYVKANGRTYIDEFLESYAHTLDSLEIEILKEKLKSHISMFELININGKQVTIEDKLDKSKSYIVIDDSLEGIILEGDYFLARIANIKGKNIFIGEAEYIPPSIIDRFYESIFLYFNRERVDKPNLNIKDYLKSYSLDVYTLYRESLVYHMEDIEDDVPPIIADIADFQDYAIENHPRHYHIYMTNLMEIFEYSLNDKDLSLIDINQIDLDRFFKGAIKDGFISSKEDYNSYLDALKAYLIFLGPSSPDYKESYNKVVEISNNRFKYMNKLKDANFIYDYDRMLVSTINGRLSSNAMTFVGDLDRFLIFAMEFEIGLTPKRKEIQRKELHSLNSLIKLSYPFISERPSQKDSRIIELFYHLTLDLNLTMIEDRKMLITEKGKNFFKLKDEEKFAIAFSYIWDKDFIKGLATPKTVSIKLEDKVVDKFLNLEYKSVDQLVDDILDPKTKRFVLATGFIRYLVLMDLAQYDKEFDIAFTSLGRLMYKYMLNIKGRERGVISFKEYREQKTKEV